MAKPSLAGTDAIVFNLINEKAVERLRREGKVELPKKKVNVPKDMRWNEKYFGSVTLEALERGDTSRDIAKAIFPEIMSKGGLVKRNHDSAVRNARTMFTSAENHGRLDSMKDLAGQGVVMKKVWNSTPDDRTRPTHIDIDGEEQNLEDLFSNGCEFPGDGKGPAEEVWMCRCAMRTHIVGFRNSDGSVSKVNYGRDETLHDIQMGQERARRIVPKGSSKPKYEVKLGETGKRYTKEEQAKLLQLLEDNDSDARNVYLKYVDELKASAQPPSGRDAFYRASEDRVYLKPRATAKGSTYNAPFGTHFHEYGHNIDYKAGGGNPISLAYRDAQGRSFEQIITQEWEKKFSEKAMWSSFEGNLDLAKGGMGGKNWAMFELREWSTRNPFNPTYRELRSKLIDLETDAEVREFIKNNIDIFRSGNYSLSMNSKVVIEDFCREIKNKYTLMERSDISDMFERFSVQHEGPTYPFGIGHGSSYAKREGSLAKEAFAEMFSAEISNPESLRVIKEMLPESYEAFKEMIGGLL